MACRHLDWSRLMQANIAIQTNPPETAVTAALRRLAGTANWCVTHTTDGGHAKGSLHYAGRAVDLADFSGPGVDTPQLLAINLAVIKALPLSQISELIYAGPGGAVCVKNGLILDGKNGRPTALAVYGTDTMSIHHNHVHLGVPANFTWTAPPISLPEAKMRVLSHVAAHHRPGFPPEQFAIMAADGGMFSFNGAPYADAYNAHPEWGGIVRGAVGFEWDADGWGWTGYFDDGSAYHTRVAGH